MTNYVHVAVVAGELVTSAEFSTWDECKADAVSTWDMWDGTRGGEATPNPPQIEALDDDTYVSGVFSHGNRMAAVCNAVGLP